MIYYLWLYLLITYGYKSKKIQSNFNLAKLFSAQLCLLRYTVIFSLQELLFKLTNSYRTFLIILWQEHIEIFLVLGQDSTPCRVADLPRYLSSSRKIWLHSLSFQPKLVKLQQIYQAFTKMMFISKSIFHILISLIIFHQLPPYPRLHNNGRLPKIRKFDVERIFLYF